MRQFILDSLLLYYNAMCRPKQLQRQLNEWLPEDPTKNTRWFDIMLRLDSRVKRRIWLLCLPWWLLGVIALFAWGYPFLSPLELIGLTISLILAGWGMMVWSPAMGLNLPMLMIIGLTANPTLWPTTQAVLNEILPWPVIITGLLTYIGGQIGGVTASYVVVARQYSRMWRLLLAPTGGGLGALLGGYLGLQLGGSGLWLTVIIAVLVVFFVALAISYFTEKALTVALGVARVVALGVAVVVAVVVTGGVALVVIVVVVAGVAGSVAVGGTGVVALVVAVVVAVVVVLVVVLVVALGMAGVVAVGVAGGVAGITTLPTGFAWAIIWWLTWLLQIQVKKRPLISDQVGFRGLFIIGMFTALRFFQGSWIEVALTIVVAILGVSGLPFNLMAWVWGQVTWQRVHGIRLRLLDFPPLIIGATKSLHALLLGLPPFSDETIWLKVPHLDDMLAAVARENRSLALQRIQEVADSRQAWAANPALIQITADSLAACNTVEKLPLTVQAIDWLPDEVSVLGRDLAEVWPRLRAISQDVATALESASPYNRRQGLDHAHKSLSRLRQSLVTLPPPDAARWQPVVDQWLRLLDEPLSQPLLAADAVLINPYEVGNPINRERASLFRGRDEVITALVQALLERNRPTLVLHGPRRMGKSSFLLQLPRLLPGRVIFVFLDMQRGGMTDSTGDFCYSLARAIHGEAKNQLQLSLPPLPPRADFRAYPFATLSDWLDTQAIPALRGDFSLLLCFDEFEKLGSAIAAKRLDERVLDELRHTIQHRQAISLLFAGVQTLEDLGPRWSSYFISVRPLEIPYLSEAEARDLIIAPDRQVHFPLEYAPAAVSQIIAVTRCQPYLVQLVCSAVVQLANRDRTLLATPALVTEAISKSLDDGAPYFQNVWEETPGTTPDMLALGQNLLRQIATTDPTPYSFLPTPSIQPALTRLLRYKVLVQIEGAGYRFDVPLLARWVRERA